MISEKRLLAQLAKLYGVQTVYTDVNHKPVTASSESLLAVLSGLGAPVKSFNDVPRALRHREKILQQEVIPPIVVAWEGDLRAIQVNLPSLDINPILSCQITLENGETINWITKPVASTSNSANTVTLAINKKLPIGYHRLTVEIGNSKPESLIIAAPIHTYEPTPKKKEWGTFLPLYSLHSNQSWGAGNYSDLQKLIAWTGELDGNVVAGLPLLPSFLDKPFEPSPYLPASRLFWNTFYIDPTIVPELKNCPSAANYLNSPSFLKEIETLRKANLVDYGRQMGLKRVILQELKQCLLTSNSKRRRDFERFVKDNPIIDDYAVFRATVEAQSKPWHTWPERLRQGVLRVGDYDNAIKNYHVYTQWLAYEQMSGAIEQAKKRNVKLYLDLPLGSHPDGYDTWRYQDNFVPRISVGAPPDTVFTGGQNWTFPPLHPDVSRRQGYQYVIACLRHHLKQAGILRIDHIMGFHRLFCIPEGMKSSQGVYVHYHPEEMYALLALESHRHQTVIVGEDLGLVSQEVKSALNRHGLRRMYVMHYELATNSKTLLRKVPANSVASLNTHDMPPFVTSWRGLDISERLKSGVLDKDAARSEKLKLSLLKKRLPQFLIENGLMPGPNNELNILKGSLNFLAKSLASLVLINLEDTWLETKMQNIPGTTTEHPNWRRKSRYNFEVFCKMPQVLTILEEVNQLRRSEVTYHGTGNKPIRKQKNTSV